ncbi:MAG: MraY family glycosyltransferase [Candidatus Sericytochromatia bacterium]|nr:MraY family glycosyltransferase [Candidatus Sericytochromatia bacterium]
MPPVPPWDPGAFGPYGPLLLAVTLLAAWLFTDLAITWVARIAYRFGRVDPVDPRKVHTVPIPRLGGVAIFLGVLTSLALVERLVPGHNLLVGGPFLGLASGACLVFLVGIIDDLHPLSAKVKLAGQIGAAVLAFKLGLRIEFLSWFDGGLLSLPPVAGLPLVELAITTFWLVGISNTINLVDGLDGLAAGITLIGALALVTIALQTGQLLPATLALALIGGTIGFLRYNFNPARIFMGDGGSLFLGFTLAGISVMGVFKLVTAVTLVLPLLIIGVPIVDTTFAILRRLWNRQPVFAPDRGHLHHRLLGAGLSHRTTVIFIYGLSLALAGIALGLLGNPGSWPMLLASGAALGWGTWRLRKSRARPDAQRISSHSPDPATGTTP